MINRTVSGRRCRINRQLQYLNGAVARFTHGTIRYAMENIGRELILVDWDTGSSTLVFPRDIEMLAADELLVAEPSYAVA